ncbi:universal stress protein [Microscilla marina]|uniref:Universal stress protein family n=1 Tax=Microscilla marina ATCC 23134 TaxID=313606 RepID=A1ZYW8_MICM2|nr:universal stress protein [Microscilla marina]EAY24404.1 universal stress protein family [Microscilla marina ATCC 23134]
MKKILVPTDFSEQAKNALLVANQIAHKSGCEIILMTVIDPPKSFQPTIGQNDDENIEQKYVQYLIENAEGRMRKLVSDIEFANTDRRTKVVLGNIYKCISETVVKEQIDLVVMGTQGASGLDEILIGSNTEKIVRTATCPVLTVRSHSDRFQGNNIVFATSLKEEQLLSINKLQAFQKVFDAHIHLLYVITPSVFATTREIEALKNNFVEKAQLKNYTFHTYSEANEESGILHFAEDFGADMIAVATHQRKGWRHFFSGSIAENIVNHAKQPVLAFSIK